MAERGIDDRPDYTNVEVAEGYEKWASTYDLQANPLIMLEEKITLELIGEIQGKQVLDLGCGTGRYCVLLGARGASVVGVDPSPQMLEIAKPKVAVYENIELYCGTIDTMDFPRNRFDLVLSALALSHLPDLEPTLQECARVLKSGGWMVISDFHPYWPIAGRDYADFVDESGREYRIPQYPHLFEEYWQLYRELGLRVEDIREPILDSQVAKQFPNLVDFQGIPLAMILKARKISPRPESD